uniref:Flagellar hook-length control protein FliK n=1 Tax=uncultured bacterium contig00042 TaxID=1181529 RepID=A0A806KIC9_9BACT|nr:flagellar hook-length control protein FliK [uncultured bacterium contig00042]
MIAITAYTEPQPVPQPVSEPQEIHEPEQDSPEEFARLLAGMLQKEETSEMPEMPDLAFDEIMDFEAEFDVLAANSTNVLDNSEGFDVKKAISNLEPLKVDMSKLEDASISLEEMELEKDVLVNVVKDKPKEKAANDGETRPKVDLFLGAKEKPVVAETAASAAKSVSLENSEKPAASETLGKKERPSGENALSKGERVEALVRDNRAEMENAISRNKGENEKASRLDEVRGRNRRDRVPVEVRDMRTAEASRAFTAVEASAARVSGEAPVREITLDLRLPDFNGNSVGQSNAQTAWEAKAGSALENMLARELHQSFNGDIVRHASIALRDGGAGTIKLNLYPESLGKVKIHLEMAENKVTGRIFVESTEALNAFRKEIDALEQAFKDAGFFGRGFKLITYHGRERGTEGTGRFLYSADDCITL